MVRKVGLTFEELRTQDDSKDTFAQYVYFANEETETQTREIQQLLTVSTNVWHVWESVAVLKEWTPVTC